jgi:Mn-dependent DtxR family transcriptional regulator
VSKLTAKQQAFCEEYMVDLNGAQAAIRAGYSVDTAKQIATENLSKPVIKKELKRLNSLKYSQYKELCVIELNQDIMSKVRELFATHQEANQWANDVITYKALELGVDTLRRSRNIGSSSRYAVMHEAGFKCQCCGAKSEKDNEVTLHIDHIIPFSIGGTNHESNLQVLCLECNISKSNRYSFNHNTDTQDA